MNIKKSDSIHQISTSPENKLVEFSEVDRKIIQISKEDIPFQDISINNKNDFKLSTKEIISNSQDNLDLLQKDCSTVFQERIEDFKNNETIIGILHCVNNLITIPDIKVIEKEAKYIQKLLYCFINISNKSEIKYLITSLNKINEGPLSKAIKGAEDLSENITEFVNFLEGTLKTSEIKEKIDSYLSKLDNDFIKEYKTITEEKNNTTFKKQLEKFVNRLDQTIQNDEDLIKKLSKDIENAIDFIDNFDIDLTHKDVGQLRANLNTLNTLIWELSNRSPTIKKLNSIDYADSNSVKEKLSDIVNKSDDMMILSKALFEDRIIKWTVNYRNLNIKLEQKLISEEKSGKIIKTILKDIFLEEKIYERIIGEKGSQNEMKPWVDFIVAAANSKVYNVQQRGALADEGIKLLVNDLNKNEKYKKVTTKFCEKWDLPDELSKIDVNKNGQYAFLLRYGGHSTSAHILVKEGLMKVVIIDSMGLKSPHHISDTQDFVEKIRATSNKEFEEFIIFQDKQQQDYLSCTIFALKYIKKFILNPEIFDKIKKEKLINDKTNELHPIFLGKLPTEFAILNQSLSSIDKIFEQAMKEAKTSDETVKLQEQYSKINKYRIIAPEYRSQKINNYATNQLFKTVGEIALKNYE
jgi:hypothetical protein